MSKCYFNISITICVLFSILGYSQKTTLKVITYNIRSIEPDFDVKPHIEYILKEKPDLVAYQEVETRTSRMNNRDLILEIASKTGMFTLFSPAYKKLDGFYGNAILSKYPITDSFYKKLPLLKEKGGSDPRVALIADIMVKPRLTIRFINVHLDHKLPDNGNKFEQLKPALDNNLSEKKVILAGDLNVNFLGELIKTLKTQGFERQTTNQSTFQNGLKLDYILTYPKSKWKLVESNVDYNVKMSDHYPVKSTIELLE